MNLGVKLIFAVCGGAAMYFMVRMVTSVMVRRSASKVALAQSIIEEQGRLAGRQTLSQKIRFWAAKRGYTGTAGPLMLAVVFIWGITAIALRIFGVDLTLALLLALPCSAGVSWLMVGQFTSRRRRLFDRQLLSALDMLVGQVESGVGPQRALESVAAAVPDPLHTELTSTLETATANRDLVGALRDLASRYPSRAFDLFIAALEIDRDLGGRAAPALRQAADILRRDFDLAQEAVAEVSQSKSEFYGIVIILLLIGATLVFGSDATIRAQYRSPLGLILVVLGVANFLFGIFRAQLLFRRAAEGR